MKFSCGCESLPGLAAVFVFIGSKHFQSRSGQVVRQRSHTPRIAGSNPASATIFKPIAREGVSKPTSFGVRRHPGQHRGARPFLFLTSSIGVSASTVAFHVAKAGAAPAWSTNSSSRSVRVCTPPCEGVSSRCKSLREHHRFNVGHVVKVASRPVKAAVPVQVRLANPIAL